MNRLVEHRAVSASDFALERETAGEAVIRWGALIALIVETILVVGGIVFASYHAIGR